MEEKTLALQIMQMPADANIHGDFFGGWIKTSK
jgi:acyl-CoA hydrolase